MSHTCSTPRVTLKRDVHVLEHPTGLCVRLHADSPPRLTCWQLATWFPCRATAERAFAAIGPAPVEIVRRVAA